MPIAELQILLLFYAIIFAFATFGLPFMFLYGQWPLQNFHLCKSKLFCDRQTEVTIVINSKTVLG